MDEFLKIIQIREVFWIIMALIFKKPISDLIDKIVNIKAGITEINFNNRVQKTIIDEKSIASASLETNQIVNNKKTNVYIDKNFYQKSGNQYSSPYNLYIKNGDLKNTVKEAYLYLKQQLNIDDTNADNKFLLEMVTDYAISLNFEKIYNGIFKSQALALMAMYNNSKKNLKRTEIIKYYNEASKQLPNFYSKYSFNNWVNFLINNNLIEFNKNKYVIKENGKAFCNYLNAHNYNINYIDAI